MTNRNWWTAGTIGELEGHLARAEAELEALKGADLATRHERSNAVRARIEAIRAKLAGLREGREVQHA